METIITDAKSNCREGKKRNTSNAGLKVALALGTCGLTIVAITFPFVMPAFRKYCLPYLPATTQQLTNLSSAFNRHAIKDKPFLDIGSGKGDIVLLAAKHKHLFTISHGVELNPVLVLLSRFNSLRSGQFSRTKFYCRDLWKFNIDNYDNICIFGVDTIMSPLEEYFISKSTRDKRIFACRFPLPNLPLIESYGEGIDTVWVYSLKKNKQDTN